MTGRFGLTRRPAAVHNPAVRELRRLPPSAASAAPVHSAAAGMSLIGHMDWKSTIGLVTTNIAASRPAHGPPVRRPRRNVSHTTSAEHSGATPTGTHAPDASAAAIISGRPGA